MARSARRFGLRDLAHRLAPPDARGATRDLDIGNRLVNWLAAAAMLAVALPHASGVFRHRSNPVSRPDAFNPCELTLARTIPERLASAPPGSEFAREVMNLDSDARETAIRDQLLSGNMPVFLRQLQPVTLTGTNRHGAQVSLTACMSPDYLAVGSDERVRRQRCVTLAALRAIVARNAAVPHRQGFVDINVVARRGSNP